MDNRQLFIARHSRSLSSIASSRRADALDAQVQSRWR